MLTRAVVCDAYEGYLKLQAREQLVVARRLNESKLSSQCRDGTALDDLESVTCLKGEFNGY